MTDTDQLLATVRKALDLLRDLGLEDDLACADEGEAALDGLVAHVGRLEGALEIIATTTYPATYLGMNERGMKMYGGSQDASNYARRVLNGEQVT